MTIQRRVGVYMRVSTEQQREDETIHAQREKAERYAALHDLQVADWYADDGVSGAIPFEDRTEGRRLVADVRAGAVDMVLVARVDRFARSLLSLLQTVDTLERRGVALVSVAESFDTGTPVGRMLLSILGSFAQFERDMIRERTMDGSARAARSGKWTGGAPPYGYRLDADHRLEIDPQEAETVGAIFARYVAGDGGTVMLADDLNARGIPPPGARRHTGRQPKGWTPTAISRILANRLYTGQRTYRGTQVVRRDGEVVGTVKTPDRRITTDVPAIIDVGTYQAAQLQARRNTTMARRNDKRGYLLKGLIRCGRCGYICVGDGSHTSGRFYYRCPNAGTVRGRWATPCGGSRVRAEAVERMVWDDVAAFAENPGPVIERLAKQLRAATAAHEPLGAETAEIERLLSTKQDERARVISLLRRGLITDAEGEGELAQVAREVAVLEQRHDAAAARQRNVQATEERLITARILLADVRGAVRDADHNTRRRAIEALVYEVVLEPDGGAPRGRTGPRIPTRVRVKYAFEARAETDYSTNAMPGVDTSEFEGPVIMSDAALWLARQPKEYTGRVLTIAQMRELGAVRPKTRIADRGSSGPGSSG